MHHVVKEKYEFMARILLDHHANPDATDDQGNTPLHIAASKGYMPVIRLLLTNHATATISNNQLYTPIHNAAAEGHTIAVRTMLDHEQSMKTFIHRCILQGPVTRGASRRMMTFHCLFRCNHRFRNGKFLVGAHRVPPVLC
ncbi:ankyrin repeat domain-containing protein [Novipirellula rosea]|uniref:ankyrin repeat domain-containing protein n=1 Tax=Novipirellula rosea TaxID=1031540 RepID=UPI003CD0A20E